MQTVLLVALILISIALIGVVLLQRSEGGALGIGGGGGMPAGRSPSNPLARATGWLAAIFMGIALLLALLGQAQTGRVGLADRIEAEQNATQEPASPIPAPIIPPAE